MGTFRFIWQNFRFLAAGFLLLLMSCPGQTFFIAIFAANIMSEFDLSDGEWGTAYTFATTASAIALFWAGKLTDRVRVGRLAVVVMSALAVGCLAMGANTSLSGLILTVFLLRFFGQGMMFQLAATAMARWFISRRGLALAISAMGFALGQALLPIILASLLGAFPWRMLWYLTAGLLLATVPVILWLLAAERTPSAMLEGSISVGMDARHWTRSEMISSWFFWLLLPMLIGPPAWGTSLFFQQVHIAEVKGWPLVDYLALVPFMTAISVSVTLVSGGVIDRLGSGRVMQFFLVPWAAAFLVLSLADTLTIAAIAFALFGLATGLQATVITAFWAEFFGTKNIGEIKAASTSIMVLGSAIGPGISGLLIDHGFSFPEQMLWIAGYFIFALILVATAVQRAKSRLRITSEIDIERA